MICLQGSSPKKKGAEKKPAKKAEIKKTAVKEAPKKAEADYSDDFNDIDGFSEF